MGVTIKISTRVYPTENVEKIKNAILLLFPDTVFNLQNHNLLGESHSLDEFAKILKDQRIRDAARGVFLRNLRNGKIKFRINKQVATVGKISFSVGDAPLGDITVEVEADSLFEVVDWIAPDTKGQK